MALDDLWVIFEFVAYGVVDSGRNREGVLYESAPDVCQACGVRPAHKGLKRRGYQFCFRCAIDARERSRIGASFCLAGVVLAAVVAVGILVTGAPGGPFAEILLWCLVAAMVGLGGVAWGLWSVAPRLRSARARLSQA